MSRPGTPTTIVRNAKAYHEYEILDTFEAGMELVGTEVKSLRAGAATMRDAYARIEDGQVFVVGLFIPEYRQANQFNHDPSRTRRLLLHRRQIDELDEKVREKGLTIVPLVLRWKDGRVKLDIGLARGRNVRDKRAASVERDAKREIDRALKERSRG